MAPQHDFILDNQTGAQFRADLNNALEAMVGHSSGPTAPTTTYAYQYWADTTDNVLKQRNASNSDWIVLRSLSADDESIGSTTWTLTANGTTDYIFAGPGFAGTETDPTIYVVRGQTYKFKNEMGAHPFQIQSTQGAGGTAYNDGITNNAVSNGTLTWLVRMDAPSTLYYQCTSHADMNGTIYVLDEGSAVASIDDLSDVDTSTVAPTDGQALVWDNANSQWEPGTVSGGSVASIDDIGDVDTTTVAPTDGQALVWDNTAQQWEPGTVSGGGGSVTSVNTQTGAVSLGIEDLDDFALNPASGTTPVSRTTNISQTNTVSSGNVGLGILSSQYTYWSFGPEGEGAGTILDHLRNVASFPIDVDIQGNTFSVTEAVYQTGTGNGSSLRLRHPSFTNASQVGGTGTWSLALTASPTTPLADGDVLQYVSADSKFKPAQASGVRSLLGIGEYADDTAAGTGGLSSGELYYNTTSSSYVLKT